MLCNGPSTSDTTLHSPSDVLPTTSTCSDDGLEVEPYSVWDVQFEEFQIIDGNMISSLLPDE